MEPVAPWKKRELLLQEPLLEPGTLLKFHSANSHVADSLPISEKDLSSPARFESAVSQRPLQRKISKVLPDSSIQLPCGRKRAASVTSEGLLYVITFPPLFVVPRCRLLFVMTALGSFLAWACTIGQPPFGWTQAQLLMYVSIPVVSTLFTYGHIWAALYMTFYPLEYVGCLQIPDTNVGCGWQGIVPSKAEKMARTSVTLMTQKLITTKDIFERIDPMMVAEELDPVLQTTLAEIIESVAMAEHPNVWAKIPQGVKNQLVADARRDVPQTIKIMMDEMKENLDKVFDLAEMVVSALTRDPGLQNHMFIECGYDELVFIRDCGAYMGFCFGVFQMGLWMVWSAGWMLPAFGLVVGMLSNWLALKMIFEPVEPYRIFGLKSLEIQGRFLKRQSEVSAVYGRIVASKVLSARNIIAAVMKGPCSDALFELVNKHVGLACNKFADSSSAITMVRFAKGSESFERCKHMVGDSLVHTLPDTMRHVEKYFDSAMDLEVLLNDKMCNMHPGDFERLLHPVFEEDEWKLVLMGGVLGVWVGCMQWYVLGG